VYRLQPRQEGHRPIPYDVSREGHRPNHLRLNGVGDGFKPSRFRTIHRKFDVREGHRPIPFIIEGTLNSTANTAFTIDFYVSPSCDASGNGEALTSIGTTNVMTDGSDNADIDVTVPAHAILFITATARDASNNTSELSACLRATTPTTVTNTNDSGAGSLSQAILDASASSGVVDVINFNIPGATVHTIIPLSPLPAITDPVVIDGYTQPGAVPATGSTAAIMRIELNGQNAGVGADGLHITAGNTTVRGLVINRFSDDVIELASNGNNTISGNYLGVDPTGTLDRGNAYGIYVNETSNNTIGGTIPAARNIISGNNEAGINIWGINAADNIVQGNYIGTSVTRAADLGNTESGIVIVGAPDNTVGGLVNGAQNTISGNGFNGIDIVGTGATGNLIQGNYIGANAAGTFDYGIDLGNTFNGILIFNAPNNVIGGSNVAARNFIINNNSVGIWIEGVSASGNQIQGNYIGIGTDVTGTNIGNTYYGLYLTGTTGNFIGDSAVGAGNKIVGGNYGGIGLTAGSTYNTIQANEIYGSLVVVSICLRMRVTT
jgi:hypothetical protein